MIYFIRRLIQPAICIAFVLYGVGVNAQVSLVKETIDKIESYKNFSYQCIDKLHEFFSDTALIQSKNIFSKSPEDKTFGYLFSIESLRKGDTLSQTEIYNGQNLIAVNPGVSTYIMKRINPVIFQLSLLGRLNWITGFIEKNPSKIVKASDTVIHEINSDHLIINTKDTIINKEYNYTRIHLFIDKLSGMPDCILYKSRSTTIGAGVTDYYSEVRYFDYKFNQDGIDIASMTPPKGFHPPEERPSLALLDSGKVAPDWTLYSADGKKMSLSQMKGKVILLDFFFIGCYGCMLSLNPLDKLHEKYKNKNFVIASITTRDSKKATIAFSEKYNIKYPIYFNADEVAKSYHVDGAPTFYFIDKEGKVANAIFGYSDNFEEKANSIIDNLINK